MKHLIKYHITTVTAAALLLLSSCNDWLDVTPRSEVKEEVMFSTEDGYKRALTGVYIQMASEALYGKSMTMYIPELMTRHWTIPAESVNATIYRLTSFDYTHTNVEAVFSNVWLRYYGAIVQLNDILTHLENNTAVNFSFRNDRLIKGEALGLRAFLHLDLLRLFGPVPAGADMGKDAIPYVTEKTKDPYKLISVSYADVLQAIENDLSAAQDLLAASDPIMTYSNSELNVLPGPVQDEWQTTRQSRFNYYACLGTKARYFQWIGQKDSASIYAQRVIDAKNSDATPKFPLADENEFLGQTANMTMFSEQLFGIHNPDLSTIVDPLFDYSLPELSQADNLLKVAYENTTHPDDIRFTPVSLAWLKYWEQGVYEYGRVAWHFRKFTGNDRVPSSYRVPLLRTAEMYLILIENLPLAEASAVLDTYRRERLMTALIIDDYSRMERVEKEYRKEFYGEGQMFYYYKRQNAAIFSWPTTYELPAGAYVVPKPKAQLSFE